MTDYSFTLTAHAKALGWDAAFGAETNQSRLVDLVGARGLAPPVPTPRTVLPSWIGEATNVTAELDN